MKIGFYYEDTLTGEMFKCINFTSSSLEFINSDCELVERKKSDINIFNPIEDKERIRRFDTARKRKQQSS